MKNLFLIFLLFNIICCPSYAKGGGHESAHPVAHESDNSSNEDIDNGVTLTNHYNKCDYNNDECEEQQ